MIDKITAKIRRFPFQTGIAAGILICLLCVGFLSLFRDHGETLAGNDEIIQQDYLRMSINEYTRNNDELLADWRYKHLGRKAGETLKLMAADESIPAQQVVSFAKAIGQADKLWGTNDINPTNGGTPANPRKGLSGFGKVLLILLGLVIIAAGGLYVTSLIKTKNRQKRRSEVSPLSDNEPLNMITPEKAQSQQSTAPDTLFDLDSLFPHDSEQPAAEDKQQEQENNSHENTDETESNVEFDSSGTLIHELNIGADDEASQEQHQEKIELPTEEYFEENAPVEENEDAQTAHAEQNENDEDSEPEGEQSPVSEITQPGLEFGKSVHMIDESDSSPAGEDSFNDNDTEDHIDQNDEKNEDTPFGKEEISQDEKNDGSDNLVNLNENTDIEISNSDAEKPLIETDSGSDPENEDELLKLIRGSSSAQNEDDSSSASEKAAVEEEADPVVIDSTENDDSLSPDQDEETAESTDDILIHYQSVYRIGNDMYDEVFSIDQGDNFRGECGISIGETLNNTEPKAVTAFEVWLFDKDDIHTATWYLMSDFALDNEGISKRLEQRGKCDRIRKHDVYVLETETLIVEIKVLELEYGTEMEEKNSYFTNVVFDVIARQKSTGGNGD
ncbi:MAG: hypothetical protein IJI57_02070 [Flexilinea sp.]|nr:hypothetical protein [Flexilinea sp.]